MSEETARQIDREDLGLRVAEAPQLAQGFASDSTVVGFAVPLLPTEAADAIAPALAASPAHDTFSLAAVAYELSWQSAMAELLSLVRMEGAAAIDGAAAKAASANALELLLASATGEEPVAAIAAHPVERQPEQAEHNGLRGGTPDFTDSAFGDLGVSVLSLQNKDLFGFDAIGEQERPQTADLYDADSRPIIDYDLFGSAGGRSVASSGSNIGDPGSIGGTLPIDPTDPGTASIGGGGTDDGGKNLVGLLKLDPGQQNITLDLEGVQSKVDDTNSLLVRGDGDDNLKLVGDWVLVSENADKGITVYAHQDSGTTLTADHVEVVLA